MVVRLDELLKLLRRPIPVSELVVEVHSRAAVPPEIPADNDIENAAGKRTEASPPRTRM